MPPKNIGRKSRRVPAALPKAPSKVSASAAAPQVFTVQQVSAPHCPAQECRALYRRPPPGGKYTYVANPRR